MLFDGTPSPLLLHTSGQVAAIVPYATAGDTVNVQVVYQNVVSNPFPVPLGSSAPAFFTADSSGSGRAAALNQDFTPNSPQNPAHSGNVVIFYATGEGLTLPAGVDGQPAVVPLPAPVLSVKVTIGGQPAIVQYAGAAPGLVAGVLQVNAVIPSGIVPGNTVPVTMTVGGTATQTGISIAAIQ